MKKKFTIWRLFIGYSLVHDISGNFFFPERLTEVDNKEKILLLTANAFYKWSAIVNIIIQL